MLSFGKKKESPNTPAQKQTNKWSAQPSPQQAKKSGSFEEKPKPAPVSKEDIRHLEETKHRLFGFVSASSGKKSAKIKELSANFDPRHSSSNPPLPPPKPIRLTSGQQQGQANSTRSSISSPDTPNTNGGQEEFGFHPLKSFAFPGLNLPALKSSTHCERTVRLKRLPSGDFNVALRRAQIVDRQDFTEQSKIVFFVGQVNRDFDSPLLAGDTLIAVGGTDIQDLNKNDVVQLIRNCESDELELTVRPISELANFSISNVEEGFNSDYNILDTGRGDLNLIDPNLHLIKSDGPMLLNGNHNRGDSIDACDYGNHRNEDLSSNLLWLAHKDGFSAARLIDSVNWQEDRKIKIKLENTGAIVDVDADDLEKANPSHLDSSENLKDLVYLNESSVLHLLRRRFANSLIHTHAGSQNMLILDNHRLTSSSMYTDKVMQYFKHCKLAQPPPHVFAAAQEVYRSMLSSKKSQALVFTGRSGSGKTSKLKHVLQYLSFTCGFLSKTLTGDKFNAALFLLESFGNCKTLLNANASRFATIFTLDFDNVGLLSAAFVQALLLEHNRVVRRLDGEYNLNIFYYFWEGIDQELKNELFLNNVEDTNLLLGYNEKITRSESNVVLWNRLCNAFKTLQIADSDMKSICVLLSSIFHLAAAGATKGIPSFKSTFLKPIFAQKAAQLLGVALEDLQKTIFMSQHQDQQMQREHRLSSSSTNRGPIVGNPRRISQDQGGSEKLTKKDIGPTRLSLDKISITDRPGDGQEALEAFLIGLYRELFNAVIALINKQLYANNSVSSTSLCLVDCPGYQRPPSGVSPGAKTTPLANGHHHHGGQSTERKPSAGFGEFCFNYVNERLNHMFYQICIAKQLELYQREEIDIDFDHEIPPPTAAIDLIDRQLQQQMLKSTNLELRSQEKRGLLWLLDEESIFPGASDESFLERVFVHHGDRKDNLLKRSRRHNHFVIRHALGSYPVTYNAAGWLKLAQENPVTRAVLPLLQDSQKDIVASLFSTLRSGGVPGLPGASALAPFDGNSSLRRTTTVFKTLVAPQIATKRKSNCAMLKLQMDLVVENVLRTNGGVYFVHCMKSHQDENVNESNPNMNRESEYDIIDVPLVRNQLRALQLLEAVRLDKIGYPKHLLFGEFKKRFECLTPVLFSSSAILDEKIAVEQLLNELDVGSLTNFSRLGLSRTFLKSEIFYRLEQNRDDTLSNFVVRLQAVCRSFLAKKRLEKRKIQILSAKCIQKNISKYMKVKSWPWWKLYTRVAPLVNVNRTDEELKCQADEIDTLKNKLTKLEKSYTELRSHCDRLESRLIDCQSELSDERHVAQSTTEALEFENKSRIRLEKELNEIQTKFVSLQSAYEKQEMQILEFRSLKTASLLVASSGDEDEEVAPPGVANGQQAVGGPGAGGSLMRDKIREMKRQIEVQRKQLTLEKLDEVEHHANIRKQTEKKLNEYQKENEELRENLNVHKRRVQKANEELQDLRNHVQQIGLRNTELEKKQKRFDSEMNALKELCEQEKRIRERISKEKDDIVSKNFVLEQEFMQKCEELEDIEVKCKAMEAELTSVDGQSNAPSTEIQLKKRNQELERKCADLEAELDDMAGEILQLQQNNTRLEMHSNKMKLDQSKEIEKQDEELEYYRSQMIKKVKSLEQQLEEELELKQRQQRQIRDLEVQLIDLQENKIAEQREDSRSTVFKRNLRKTKALLKDAQVMLEHYQKQAPNKGVMKQLKNQLEDAEALHLAAVKSKQSLENEMDEVRRELSALVTLKNSADERCLSLLREKTCLDARINDQDYELQELLKKYKAQVQQGSVTHITMNDQIRRISELEKERDVYVEKVAELNAQLERFESQTVDKHKIHLADGKIRELESKLDLELTSKSRLEATYIKAKEDCERLRDEITTIKAAKDREAELAKRFQQQLQHAQDSSLQAQKREVEATQRCSDLTASLERLEQENSSTVADLKLALRRIDDLQTALQSDQESDLDKFDNEDDDDDEDEDTLVVGNHGNAVFYESHRPSSVNTFSVDGGRSTRRSGSLQSRSSRKPSEDP